MMLTVNLSPRWQSMRMTSQVFRLSPFAVRTTAESLPLPV